VAPEHPQGITMWVNTSAVPVDHPNRDLAVAVLVEYRVGRISGKKAMDDLCYYLLGREK
jgi:hypothetical protein